MSPARRTLLFPTGQGIRASWEEEPNLFYLAYWAATHNLNWAVVMRLSAFSCEYIDTYAQHYVRTYGHLVTDKYTTDARILEAAQSAYEWTEEQKVQPRKHREMLVEASAEQMQQYQDGLND